MFLITLTVVRLSHCKVSGTCSANLVVLAGELLRDSVIPSSLVCLDGFRVSYYSKLDVVSICRSHHIILCSGRTTLLRTRSRLSKLQFLAVSHSCIPYIHTGFIIVVGYRCEVCFQALARECLPNSQHSYRTRVSFKSVYAMSIFYLSVSRDILLLAPVSIQGG